jgi:hypothetical protein
MNTFGTPGAANSQAAPAGSFFEYTGPTVLTAIGGMTGRTYRFTGSGARLRVDARDRWSMLRVPALREVR